MITIPRERDETGAVSLVTVAIIVPATMMVILTIVQVALLAHARSVATSAAQQGADVAQRFDGTTSAAEAETYRYLDAMGSRMLTSRDVTVTRGPDQASVTVTGQVFSLVPGIHPRVSVTSAGPLEQFRPPVDQAH